VAGLRGVDSPPQPERTLNVQLAAREGNVLPLERQGLAQPEAGSGHEEEQRVEAGRLHFGQGEEPGELVSIERADAFLPLARHARQTERAPEAGSRVRSDHVVLDCRREQPAQDRVEEPDGFGREVGRQFLREEGPDRTSTEPPNLERPERWEDVLVEPGTVDADRPRFEVGAQGEPALSVFADRDVGIDSGELALPRGRQRPGEGVFRLVLRLERLPAAPAVTATIVEHPTSPALADAGHSLTALLAARARRSQDLPRFTTQ
jgi:hypothetical protein